jgi:hypothetical protein
MKATIRTHINTLNAEKSIGPTSAKGKQRSSMNAWKHGLTGNRMLLQTHELEAYQRLTTALTGDLNPATEQERQLVQKLIDCHTRLNRIAALRGVRPARPAYPRESQSKRAANGPQHPELFVNPERKRCRS